MKSLLTILAIFVFFLNQTQAASIPKLNSAHSNLYELDIYNGLIYSTTTNPKTLKTQIALQLKFLVGHFNYYSAGPDLQRLEIYAISSKKIKNSIKVNYKARMTLAWAKNVELPDNLLLYLPERGTQYFINLFTQTYNSGKYGECAESGHDHVDPNSFFYYYRPLKESCQIKNRDLGTNDLLVTMNASVLPSSRETSNKKPAYQKIWKDNELTLFIINGKYEKKGLDNSDAGIDAFEKTYQQFIKKFGVTNTTFDSSRPFVELLYQLPNQKKIKVRILLVGQMHLPTPQEVAIIQKYTGPSDIVIYNGHAGLGLSSNKLAEIATFQKDRYQIYFLDGCDTFSYLGKRLFERAQKANPGKKGSEFVDTITNSMPSYFSSGPANNIHIVESMLAGTDTYYKLLSNLDENQRSVVDGEEDN